MTIAEFHAERAAIRAGISDSALLIIVAADDWNAQFAASVLHIPYTQRFRMQSLFMDAVGTADWAPISATHLGFAGTITADEGNGSAIQIRSVDNDTVDSTLVAREYVTLAKCDLNKIEIKGDTLTVKVHGNTDPGW